MRRLDHLTTQAGWRFPKFAAMVHFPELIEELGGAGAASTGRFESFHRDINCLAAFTNHTVQDRVLQVTRPSM